MERQDRKRVHTKRCRSVGSGEMKEGRGWWFVHVKKRPLEMLVGSRSPWKHSEEEEEDPRQDGCMLAPGNDWIGKQDGATTGDDGEESIDDLRGP